VKYEIEITGAVLSNEVFADIKHRCGEVVESWLCPSFVDAGKLIDTWIKANPYTRHVGCTSEYCKVKEPIEQLVMTPCDTTTINLPLINMEPMKITIPENHKEYVINIPAYVPIIVDTTVNK